jgi:glycine cleavage system aminomethyltransferase T
MGQRTPLYDLHLALGAKMVDFGGWDMPCITARRSRNTIRCAATAGCSMYPT